MSNKQHAMLLCLFQSEKVAKLIQNFKWKIGKKKKDGLSWKVCSIVSRQDWSHNFSTGNTQPLVIGKLSYTDTHTHLCTIETVNPGVFRAPHHSMCPLCGTTLRMQPHTGTRNYFIYKLSRRSPLIHLGEERLRNDLAKT